MAEGSEENEDRTEEATPERREEFRSKGQIAVSKEITSVAVLASIVALLSVYFGYLSSNLIDYLDRTFRSIEFHVMSEEDFQRHLLEHGFELLKMIAPMFIIGAVVATFTTFMQTRLNFSMKRLKPSFSRMNPFSGLVRMVSGQAAVELFKGIGKMSAIAVVAYLILYSELDRVPGLMEFSIIDTWIYWAEITKLLFWAVAALMLLIGGGDYLYNWLQIEKKLKMTKQEIKEEYKKRESDPHVKAKIKRLQREIANSKALSATEGATALITNPTHYAIAIRYELGMSAPIVVAKGKDYLALRMKETAKKADVPIIENKPLARTLFKIVKEGEHIPEELYKAVSEVIRYVFAIKGRKTR